MRNMGRGDFMKGLAASVVAGANGAACDSIPAAAPPAGEEALSPRDRFQLEIDGVTPEVYTAHYERGSALDPAECERTVAEFPALGRYEDAFEKVVRKVRETEVAGHPLVWLVYNMGIIVKTRKTLFSVDLQHRRAEELAPLLDFALITHNHLDHYTQRFLYAMNRVERKTVVSNFCDNYGAHFGGRHPGGYTRAVKTFEFGDVTVRTTYTDHNDYLVDFTTAFEIVADGLTIFHSGDCSNAAKLKPLCPNPDLWFVHPYCGMKAVDGAAAVNPKVTVVAHLNEMSHAKGRARWTWAQGEKAKAKLEAAGYRAVVPLWGDRIV